MGSPAKIKSRNIPPSSDSELARLESIFDTALRIAEQRREILIRMRAALKANDAAEVFRTARELCGLHDDEKSNRIN
jgi:hypothetical protein